MSLTLEAWKKLQAEYERTSGRTAHIDYNGVIRNRKRELFEMAKSKKKPSEVMEQWCPETREMILRYHELDPQEFLQNRRKNWKSRDMIKFAGRMSLVFTKACLQRTNHIMVQKRYVDEQTDSAGRVKIRHRDAKSSLGKGMVVALTTAPKARTNKHLRKITWLQRTTKAFRQLFPPDREVECARHLSYAKYEDGRLIAQQGCTPDWFYYVIAGKIVMLRQYELTSGMVNKPMGYLLKGMTSDPEEIENQSEREFSLVAKGQVEVLLLHKSVYHQLQSLGDGPPVSYLSFLELFEEFPVEMFMEHPESVEMKYYGDGKVIVKDTNRTPWIHIVKSGVIKVVRRQMVMNSVADIFNQQHDDQLGTVKSDSHAEAMLGVNYKQRQNKAKSGESLLPQLSKKRCLVNGSSENKPAKPRISKDTQDGDTADNPRIRISEASESPEGSYKRTVVMDDVIEEAAEPAPEASPRQIELSSLPPLINLPSREKSVILEERRDFLPHAFYLTREKTDASALKKRFVHDERRAYLELGTLSTGDVFGLDHMDKPTVSEPAGLSLLSDGVEVVKVSKRFFLQYAQNNTMLKLETLHQQYMSDDEAKDTLHGHQLWSRYKTSLIDRVTDRILSKNSPKHRKPGMVLTKSRFQEHVNQFRARPRNRREMTMVSQSARF